MIKIQIVQTTESNAFIRGETKRVKFNDQFTVHGYCNNVECKALRHFGSSICSRSIFGDQVDWIGDSIRITDAFERPLCHWPRSNLGHKNGFHCDISIILAAILLT